MLSHVEMQIVDAVLKSSISCGFHNFNDADLLLRWVEGHPEEVATTLQKIILEAHPSLRAEYFYNRRIQKLHYEKRSD